MIEIRNLNFGYERSLFNNLNLFLGQGKITGLLGHNGAGKSTLLKLICGLLEVQSGSVTVNNLNPRRRSPEFLKNVFYVPEQLEIPDLLPEKFAQKFGRLFPKFDLSNYFSLLESLQVDSKAMPTSLSFGQKRKSILAFGIATDSDLLILDEPSNGFDIYSQVKIRQILKERMHSKRSILISTHHIREFEDTLEDIIILNDAKVVLQKSVLELKEPGREVNLEQVFLQATSKTGA